MRRDPIDQVEEALDKIADAEAETVRTETEEQS